jgi:phospholipid transport system transporter-binding protein
MARRRHGWTGGWLAWARRLPGLCTVDASALQSFDSSALAVLLEARRRAIESGRPFGVQGMPPRLRQLAALYGVDGLLAPAG